MSGSFRLRIALLSVLVSGAVLCAFGYFAWRMLYRTALQQVDAGMQDLAQLHLSAPHDPQHWRFLDESLREVYGREGGAVLILVRSQEGRVLHESAEWPFPPESPLPVPGALQEPLATRPMPGRGGPGGRPRMVMRQTERPDSGAPPFPPGGPGRAPEDRAQAHRGPGPPPGGPSFPGEHGFSDGPGFPGGPRPRFAPPPPPMPLRQPDFQTLRAAGGPWRVGAFGNPEVTLHAAAPLNTFTQEMAAARNVFLTTLPLALLCIALASWWLAGRALRPVDKLTATIAGVSARGLDQRVEAAGQAKEFTRLIQVFNEMMGRLQLSFEQAMRFSADAAHELKTPLTIFQGELEQALKHAPPEQQPALARLIEEVQRLKAIVQKLLLLALADAGQLKLHREPVDLAEMLEELLEDARILAPHLHIEGRMPAHLAVPADRDLLRQAIQNLVSNALKYTPPKGHVRLSLAQENASVRLSVLNHGSISPEARAHVFDRFYRADKAHSREIDGAGLGLSLAREITRAHGGDLRLDPSQDGTVCFTLVLPCESWGTAGLNSPEAL